MNDLTDAIITKDPSFGLHHQQQGGPPYHLGPGHFVRTGFSGANTIPSKTPPTQSQAQLSSGAIQMQPMGQEQIIATDQWKLNRRLQQQQQHKEEMAKSGGNPQGRSTPDDRHIIRMAQTPSPRNNKMAYEPVSPPETSSHYHIQPKITINAYDQRNMQISQENAPGGDANKLFKMLNHRIAEVMRNDTNDHGSDGKDRRESDVMKVYERPRSGNSAGPGNGVDGGDKSPAGKRESPQVYISRPSSQPGNPQFQSSPSMAFMYPYSALTIPQAASGANPIISPKAANELMDTNRQPPPQHLENRQVLSEQYDALSDED